MTGTRPDLPFLCWPCRTSRHIHCDRLRGCECAVIGTDDVGRILLCPALLLED